MRFTLKFLLILLCIATATPSYARKDAKGKAGASGGAKGGKASSRERHIVREAQAKKQDKSKIDFDETAIAGEKKQPLGSMINQNKNDKNYDLIKIRLRWHPEMVQSTSSLESGG